MTVRPTPRRVALSPALAAACLALLVAGVLSETATGPGAVLPGHTASAGSAATSEILLCPHLTGRISCLSERVRVKKAPGTGTDAAGSAGLTPADLHSAYLIPPTSTTATVAVVDAYDDPSVEADMATYRKQFGLPACTTANGCFRKVNQQGADSPLPPPSPAGDDWSGETSLDTQMVSAACPSCHILLVEADDDDSSGQPNLEAAVARAATMGADYISMSWGGAESTGEATSDASYFGASGVVYVASSGDNGYGTSWPAADPDVVSVGGTTLKQAANARGWIDTAWGASGGEGTGSGCSAYEPRPAWQDITAITAVCSNRAQNDVAIVADPNTGVLVYDQGSWWLYGGTSVGAPLITAMYAMAGKPGTAPAASLPYGHPTSFLDVTAGLNGTCASNSRALCHSGPGWDGPTGLGVPQGLGGFSPLPASVITVHNPGTVSGVAGTAVALDVHATDSNLLALRYAVRGLPGGTVLHGNGTISGVPSKGGAFTVTVTASDTLGYSRSTAFHWNVAYRHMVTARAPHLSATPRVGVTVQAVWSDFHAGSAGGPVIHPLIHILWYRNGVLIRGATSRNFTVPASYRGSQIQFRLAATATYYANYTSLTPRSAVIR